MPDNHANFAYSTVATPPSPALSGLSLTVADASSFPSAPFNAVVWPAGAQPLASNAEIVRVSAIVGTTFTIARMQEGSTGRAISAGDQIANAITSKVITDIEGALAVGSDGWTQTAVALTYSSTDGHTFVCSTGADLSGTIPVGARLKCTISAAVQYFIVTAVNSTTITLYGGQNYSLTASAITNVYWSWAKAPFGFSTDPTGWTEQLKDASNHYQASPTLNQWYAPGSLALVIPIGVWDVQWQACLEHDWGAGNGDVWGSLSTSTSSVSDADFTAAFEYTSSGGINITLFRRKTLVLASKATYTLIARQTTQSPGNGLGFSGSVVSPSIIRAVCAYL